MIYSPEDYVEFYNDHTRKENAKHGWIAVLTLLAIIGGSVLLMGCDGQAAEATRESVMTATEKKQALMGHPCTYVAQCGNPISDCPVSKRKCVSADLTERK